MLKGTKGKNNLLVAIVILVQLLFGIQVFSAEEVSTNEEVNSLPVGWQSKDIGEAGLEGNSNFIHSVVSADKFKLSGAGNGFEGVEDSYHFAYQKITGDFSIEATPYIVKEDQKIKAGIMIRDDLYSDAAFVGMFVTDRSEAVVQARRMWNSKVGTAFDQKRTADMFNEYSLKLVRNGGKIVCLLCTDGVNWNQIGEPIKIDIGKSVYAGLCVTSEDSKVLSQCDFSNVGIQTSNIVYTKPYVSDTIKEGTNGVNLAIGKTIISSSQKVEKSAINAIDGKENTVWSVDGTPHSFTVDLGDIYNIDSFETILPKKQALKYKIETSTDANYYNLIVDKTSNTKKTKSIKDLYSVAARYVKLTIFGINNISCPQINVGEFKVIGSDKPTSKAEKFTIFDTGFMSNVPSYREPEFATECCTYYSLTRKNRALVLGSNSSFIKEFSTEGYSDIIIEISRWIENCEKDESFIIEWFDGNIWETLEEVKGNISRYVPNNLAFMLPVAASDNKNCKIRIRTENYDNDDAAFLDHISIEGKYVNAPLAPKNLQIQSITDNSAVISWDEFEDCLYVCHYDIYLEDGTKLGTSRDTTFLVSNLDNGKEYMVYVKAVNTAGVSSIASKTISIKIPESYANKTVYYEAEEGKMWGSVCVVEDSECSGGKKVVKETSAGWDGAFDMNIHCETAGKYVLTFFYYSPDVDFQQFSINGLGVETYPYRFGYANYDYIVQRSFNVQLKAGDNALSIYNPSFPEENAIDRVAFTLLEE